MEQHKSEGKGRENGQERHGTVIQYLLETPHTDHPGRHGNNAGPEQERGTRISIGNRHGMTPFNEKLQNFSQVYVLLCQLSIGMNPYAVP